MSRGFFILIISFICSIAYSQEKLKVTYEGTTALDETNATSKFGGRFVPTTFELIIDGKLSEFKHLEKLITSQEGERPAATIASEDFYIDLNQNLYFYKWNFNNKDYIISDTLKILDWKLEKDAKELLGISLRKATFELGDDKITAWYAPKLPYKIGPELYGGLPGLILEIEIKGISSENAIWTDRYVAQNVEVLQNNYKVKFPKGKIISEAESEAIYDESVEKIKEMYKGGVEKD